MAMHVISELTQHLWKTLDAHEEEAFTPFPGELTTSLKFRRETLRRFRDQWDGDGEWIPAYKAWLKTDEVGTPDYVMEKAPEGVPVIDEKEYPSLAQMAGSFAKEATKFLSKGMPVVTKEEFNRRMGICEACEKFNAESRRCFVCGCFMDAKAKMATTKCKIGKW